VRQQGRDPRRANSALGVRETNQVLGLVRQMRDKGLGIILISHNMPNVFDIADRIMSSASAAARASSARSRIRCRTPSPS